MTLDRTTSESASNRRTFFRIEDSLQVSYKPISLEELDERVAQLYRDDLDHFSVASEVIAMRNEVVPLLRQISSQSTDLANYLASLDQRLDLLARAIASRDNQLTEQPVRTCNLSASGIAIPVDKLLEQGVMLEMNLLLLPSYATVRAIAEVVDCDTERDTEDGLYLARLNFTHVREKDRDLLIKHIIQRQGEMLRRRREEREEF